MKQIIYQTFSRPGPGRCSFPYQRLKKGAGGR